VKKAIWVEMKIFKSIDNLTVVVLSFASLNHRHILFNFIPLNEPAPLYRCSINFSNSRHYKNLTAAKWMECWHAQYICASIVNFLSSPSQFSLISFLLYRDKWLREISKKVVRLAPKIRGREWESGAPLVLSTTGSSVVSMNFFRYGGYFFEVSTSYGRNVARRASSKVGWCTTTRSKENRRASVSDVAAAENMSAICINLNEECQVSPGVCRRDSVQ
jgi:hypothetical protein